MANLDVALRAMAADFPFERYLYDLAEQRAHAEIVLAVRSGAGPTRVLDVGAGSCEKAVLLAEMDCDVVAVETFSDPWHAHDRRIVEAIDLYAKAHGVDLRIGWLADMVPAPEKFDIVVLANVIEHQHDSPRDLLNQCIAHVKTDGHLVVSMPNSVNLRKRIDVLRGRTNYCPARQFFDAPAPWGGHVREWTPNETADLLRWAGLSDVQMETRNTLVAQRLRSGVARTLYDLATRFLPSARDSIFTSGTKAADWTPVPAPDPTVPTREILFK